MAVCITVDVDGEAGLPDGGRGYEHRLSSRSERSYGLLRGLPRVLGVLGEFGVLATFYVPGVTAERSPDALLGASAAGHEIAHHGHTHRRPDTLDPEEQRADVEEGIQALTALTGRRPDGYRAPAWELTTDTLAALVDLRFAFDSSLMGDDRPYVLELGAASIVELPVHWSLDDAPHFEHSTDPAGLLAVWRRELFAAADEDRDVTFTLHPEILGRPHRIDVLRRLLDAVTGHDLPCRTHGDVAAALTGA